MRYSLYFRVKSFHLKMSILWFYLCHLESFHLGMYTLASQTFLQAVCWHYFHNELTMCHLTNHPWTVSHQSVLNLHWFADLTLQVHWEYWTHANMNCKSRCVHQKTDKICFTVNKPCLTCKSATREQFGSQVYIRLYWVLNLLISTGWSLRIITALFFMQFNAKKFMKLL